MGGEVIQGDCLEVMSFIPDKSIDMVITSPPYDDLRSYNRKYILIEKEPIYVDIINDRLNLVNDLTISK